jgi:predicted nucleotidyltransferase
MEKSQKIADDLLKFTNARSIFLYGSRARDDFNNGSDYEIGVLMDREKYISRADIKENFNIEDVNIFPFYYDNFIAGNPDTPFQKSIYMREIVEAGKTLVGEKIIENIKPPAISLLDIIQDVRFNLGYALAATHSFRNGDNITAALHLAKSCLFGTRDYIIFKQNKLLISYDKIVDATKELDLQEYQNLPVYAEKLRKGEIEVEEKYLFQNISYLNKFIENELLTAFREKGSSLLIK